MSRANYEKVLRDTLGLFKIGVEQQTSAKQVAEMLGLDEYQITHVKRFLDVADALRTRIEGGPKGHGGRVSYWTVVKTADETMDRLKQLGLDDFSTASRKKIASGSAFDKAQNTPDSGRVIPDSFMPPGTPQEDETVSPSKKHLLLEIFQKNSDKRGKVKGLTWKDVQTLVGDGVGLHAVFHLCRSLQRDGAIRFIDLPTKMSTALEASKTYVDITVVIRKKRRGKSGPAYVTKGPAAPPRSAMPNGKPAPAAPVYVPYLSPAGPVPHTPIAEGLKARVEALREAKASLERVDGLTTLVEGVNEKLELELSGRNKELLALYEWAQKTADQARVHEARERAADKQPAHVS